MKKLILASLVAAACGSASMANAAATISFDRDGAGGVGAIAVDNFDWNPGNALAIGAFSTPPDSSGNVIFQLVAQGKLGNFVGPGLVNTAPVGGTEFTFRVSYYETSTTVGLANSAFTGIPGMPSSFEIFYDTSPDADNITGNGFGDGLSILRGTLASSFGTFQDNTTFDPSNFPITLLDGLNADNQSGVLSRQGTGSNFLRVDVNYSDPNFFKSNITSLAVDLQDNTFNNVPFLQTDPSDQVFGITPYYSVRGDGKLVNGGDPIGTCAGGGKTEAGVAGARCDLHLQTDATTSFNPTVPEPGSLALVGLALAAGAGVIRRRAAGR